MVNLNGGDAQVLQIGDLFNQAPIGAGLLDLGRVVGGEPANVRLVNNGFTQWNRWLAITRPIIRVVYDHTFGEARAREGGYIRWM